MLGGQSQLGSLSKSQSTSLPMPPLPLVRNGENINGSLVECIVELPHHGVVAAAYGATERVEGGWAAGGASAGGAGVLVCWLLHQAVCHPTWTVKSLVYH